MKKLMLVLFLMLIIVSNVSAGIVKKVYSDDDTTFAIDDNGKAYCWGDHGRRCERMPELVNPKMIAGQMNISACAIDDNGIQCWGDAVIRTIPKFTNPKFLALGDKHACAIDDIGLKCWVTGFSSYDIRPVPKDLRNPRMVSISTNHTCALDDGGVQCWGDQSYNEVTSQLKNPKMISSGGYHSCALDDKGVKCWGSNDYGQLNVPKLLNPKTISAGKTTTCAIDDEGVKCWGRPNYPFRPMPKFTQPKAVSVGSDHACVVDDYEVVCWGNETYATHKEDAIPEEIILAEQAEFERRENIRIAEEERRKAEEAREILKRSKLALQIPKGSSLNFSKEILIGINKTTVLIGSSVKNLTQCLMIVEPNSTTERRIRAGKVYSILKVENAETGNEIETIINLDGISASISCFSNYPNNITIGEVQDSLASFGIILNVLDLAEPEDL